MIAEGKKMFETFTRLENGLVTIDLEEADLGRRSRQLSGGWFSIARRGDLEARRELALPS